MVVEFLGIMFKKDILEFNIDVFYLFLTFLHILISIFVFSDK